MAEPTQYERTYGFANYQANNPSRPLPGHEVDRELDDIANSLLETVTALGDVRRSDGALQNLIVTYDSLSYDLRRRLFGPIFDFVDGLEAASDLVVAPEQLLLPVRIRGQIIFYARDAAGTALTTADGAVWTPLRTGARYQSIAWGDGWEGVWKSWEWQKAQRGRIDLEIPPGISVVQPTDGTSASRRLVALNIPINFANFGTIVRMSTEPVVAVSAGYIQPVAVTNIVESTTVVTLPDGEDGEGGTSTETQEVTTITLASLAGYEATTGLVAYITDDDMTPLNPDGTPVLDGFGNPLTPGIPEHIVRRRGENFVIWRAEAGTSGSPRTDLIVRKPLNFNYNLSANCRVWLLRNTEIEIHAGNVEDGNPREPGDPAFNPIIHIEAAKNPRVHSLRCEYSGSHIVQFLQCYEPVFKDFTIGYIANQNNPWHTAGLARYGARFVNCAKFQVSDGLAGHGRHVADFLSLTYTGFSYLKPDPLLHPLGSGASMDGTVTDVTSWGATAPPFSTHDGTFRIKFANCHAIKPASWGFASRGVGHVFDGCSDVDANGVLHCFVGGRYIGRGTAITRDITLRNHTSVNPRGLGLLKINDGAQSFLAAGWVVRFTEDGSGAVQRLADLRTGADVSISGLRMDIRRAQGMDELFKITGSGTAGAIRLTDSEVIDWTGADSIDYLMNNAGPAYLHMISGMRAYRGDAQQQLITALYTGTAPSAGSHITRSRIVGLWSEDEVAPDRATILAAYVSNDRQVVSYLSSGVQVDLRREPSVITDQAATTADGKLWLPAAEEWSPRAFGVIGAGDDTEAVRACCLAASTRRIPVTFAGIPTAQIEADAQIDVWTRMYGHGCVLSALNGLRAGTGWNMTDARKMFVVLDPSTPLVSAVVAATPGNVVEFSETPTADFFAGPGYAYLQGAAGSTDYITNRSNDGTLTYRQVFRVSDNGRVKYPLSRALPGTSSLSYSYRAMPAGGTITISDFVFDLASVNNQIFFEIERNDVVVEKISATGASPSYNSHALISITHACNITVENLTVEAQLNASTADASYVLRPDGCAELRVENFHAFDGWGAIGSDHVSGFYVSNSTLNRFDCHAGGFNMFIGDCTLSKRGVTFGWGGGILSVSNCTLLDCAVSMRSDYDKAVYNGTWTVENVTFSSTAFVGTVLDMQNVGSTQIATQLPRSITVRGVKRVPQAGGDTDQHETDLINLSIRTNAVSVQAPKSVLVADCLSIQRGYAGVQWPCADMEPNDGLTKFVMRAVAATNIPTTALRCMFNVPAATKTSPATGAPVEFRASDCIMLTIDAAAAGGSSTFRVKNSSVGRAKTPATAVCKLVGCELENAALISPETSAPIGNTAGSGSGNLGYTSLFACTVANNFDLSNVYAMSGVAIRAGHSPTLPGSATKATAFTGYLGGSF